MNLISFPSVEDNLVSTELSPVKGVNSVLTSKEFLVSISKQIQLVIALITILLTIVLSFFSYKSLVLYEYKALHRESSAIYNFLMSVRSVGQKQFLSSGIPLTKKTVGFLPAHSLPRISEEFSEKWDKRGIVIRTSSDRPCNSKNQANEQELDAMQWFRDSDERTIFTEETKDSYFYARPIWVKKSCLKCHGKQEKAPKTIRENYNIAYDYNVGDLRGVVSITTPIHGINKKILADLWSKVLLILLAGLLSALLVNYFLQRFLKQREVAEANLKDSQQVIKTEHQRMSSILKSLDEGLVITGIDEVVQIVNPALTKLTGKQESEIVGTNFSTLFAGGSEEKSRAFLNYFQAPLQPLHDSNQDEFHRFIQDGPIPVLVLTIKNSDIDNIFIVNNHLAEVFGYTADEMQNMSLLDLLPGEDVQTLQRQLANTSGGIEEYNKASFSWQTKDNSFNSSIVALRLKCSSRTNILIRFPFFFNTEEHPITSKFCKCFYYTQYSTLQYELECKGRESIPVTVSGAPLYKTCNSESHFDGAVLVMRDMRTQNEIEQERQKNAYQAGISEMSSTILHNIGNTVTPLTESSFQLKEQAADIKNIANIVEEVYNDTEVDPKSLPKDIEGMDKLLELVRALPDVLRNFYQDNLCGYLKKIDDGVEHVAEIVRVQQSLVKGSTKNHYIESFNLHEAVDSAIALISSSLEKREIKVELDIQVKNVTLPYNPFVQMVNNLIKNSQEAIVLNENIKEPGAIKITATANGADRFYLTISDNGCGIESEKQQEIFKFGYTDKRSGSGFGLHSVANFIHSLNGSIQVASTGAGKGATFTITLPVVVHS